MSEDRHYTPAQAVHYSKGAVIFCLRHYWSHLHRGKWPEKGGGGCETHSKQPHAPHEEASAIAGELCWRLSQQGRVGTAIFEFYTGIKTMKSLAHIMGWAEYGLHCEMKKAFTTIWEGANPDKLRCECCGRFLSKNHTCPVEREEGPSPSAPPP